MNHQFDPIGKEPTVFVESKKFPPGFRWGVATAATQIEGAAKEDGRGESIWDHFAGTAGTAGNIEDGTTPDVAVDHYHRFEEDIALMKELGVTDYRFSIAWTRILPDGTGRIEERGLQFYDRLVYALLEAGITPWVTLYHWDLPQKLEDQGGWTSRETAYAFAKYVDIVTQRLGDRVKHWFTLNEPWCSAILGYSQGVHAPGRKSLSEGLQAAHHLLLAHGMAVPIIRKNSKGAKVGIVLNVQPVYPVDSDIKNRQAASRFDGSYNRWFLDPLYGRDYPEDMLTLYGNAAPPVEENDMKIIAAKTDFLGVNYYFPQIIRDGLGNEPLMGDHVALPGVASTDMGWMWMVYPRSLYDLLQRLQKNYPIPAIYITENGAAYPDTVSADGQVHDPKRELYIKKHLAAILRAIADGIPVKGYFVWSLIDNWEWDRGNSTRFGIVYVDYARQLKRIIKDSGRRLAQIIAQNSL